MHTHAGLNTLRPFHDYLELLPETLCCFVELAALRLALHISSLLRSSSRVACNHKHYHPLGQSTFVSCMTCGVHAVCVEKESG